MLRALLSVPRQALCEAAPRQVWNGFQTGPTLMPHSGDTSCTAGLWGSCLSLGSGHHTVHCSVQIQPGCRSECASLP